MAASWRPLPWSRGEGSCTAPLMQPSCTTQALTQAVFSPSTPPWSGCVVVSLSRSVVNKTSLSLGPETVWALWCVAERRATRVNDIYCQMLCPERPKAVSPERGVVLTDLQSSIDGQ